LWRSVASLLNRECRINGVTGSAWQAGPQVGPGPRGQAVADSVDVTVEDGAVEVVVLPPAADPMGDARRDVAARLVEEAQATGVDLVGPGGLLAELTKRVTPSPRSAPTASTLVRRPRQPLPNRRRRHRAARPETRRAARELRCRSSRTARRQPPHQWVTRGSQMTGSPPAAPFRSALCARVPAARSG
jgi:hypothetical protein